MNRPAKLPRIETSETFTLLQPDPSEGQVGRAFLLNSPHSGDEFPPEFLARAQLPRETMRRASDLFVDRLIEPLTGAGATLMRAHLPRSYIDLNREPLELDPRLISGPLPVEANTRSLRVAGGLGTVPRVIGDQVEIYAGKLTLAEALTRIERFYVPYHRRLVDELAALRAACGFACLIDCHSMPSTTRSVGSGLIPDIVVGDRFGASASPVLLGLFEDAARAEGFRVERNQPYAGGYITECYGRPSLGWHAFQIEVNRALYMDERRLEPHADFAEFAMRLRRAFLKFFADQAFVFRATDLQFYQKAAE
ncbi:MAG: N-formylglutamate amidohydrolase [Rhizobiales bacterium]|nr:N-formylglutamate amidohydrolase [Hyphomicrobiales bacterium]